MKNVINKLIISLHTAEERVDEFKYRSIETSQTVMQRLSKKEKELMNMEKCVIVGGGDGWMWKRL